MPIRPFALERYFAEHEFSAELPAVLLRRRGLTLPELLALADAETAPSGKSSPSATPRARDCPSSAAKSRHSIESVAREDVLVFAGAEEAILSGSPACSAGAIMPSSPGPATSRSRVARGAGADVSRWELRDSELGAGSRRAARPLRPDHAAHRRQLPPQSNRRAARSRELGRDRLHRPRRRCLALLRRGLPRAGIRSGRPAARGRGLL